jgi:hypothetical protein
VKTAGGVHALHAVCELAEMAQARPLLLSYLYSGNSARRFLPKFSPPSFSTMAETAFSRKSCRPKRENISIIVIERVELSGTRLFSEERSKERDIRFMLQDIPGRDNDYRGVEGRQQASGGLPGPCPEGEHSPGAPGRWPHNLDGLSLGCNR